MCAQKDQNLILNKHSSSQISTKQPGQLDQDIE